VKASGSKTCTANPCDFFVYEDLKLGNISENTLEEIWGADRFLQFGRQKPAWDACCDQCGYLAFCAGDCLKHRGHKTRRTGRLSWLCEGWKKFFNYSWSRFETLAHGIREQKDAEKRSAAGQPTRKIGRNEPCPCGSGLKYKKCCLTRASGPVQGRS